MKYADLSVAHDSEYVFDFDRMVALTGNTGPYLQYAAARIRSIFRKAGTTPGAARTGAPVVLTEPAERALALALLGFGDVVAQVGDTLEPHRLCAYLFDLAQTFTTFYEQCPVLKADDARCAPRGWRCARSPSPCSSRASTCSASPRPSRCEPLRVVRRRSRGRHTGAMKWTRAVHHLETLAQSCTDLGSRPAFSSLRVEQLWVAGEVLDEPRDVETVTVALVVDLPVDEVPWRSEPPGAQHWANGARLGQSPVLGAVAVRRRAGVEPPDRAARAALGQHRRPRPGDARRAAGRPR